MIGREVSEWIGSRPDTRIPTHVKLRILQRCDNRCHISGREILPGDEWDFDHIIALCNGGENRESNIAPAIRAKHREKSAADISERAKVDRIRTFHLGLKKPSRPMPGSRSSGWKKTMSGKVVRRNP